MKSYHINLGAGLDGLVMQEHDTPMPGPRQVLVRVRASSLNYRELMILIKGSYPLPVRPDGVPVSDGAGEVVAGQMIETFHALLKRDAELLSKLPPSQEPPPPLLYDPEVHRSHPQGG